jgi:hypothetical protein
MILFSPEIQERTNKAVMETIAFRYEVQRFDYCATTGNW